MKLRPISLFLVLLFLLCLSALCAIPEGDNLSNDDGERTGVWILELNDDMEESYDYEDTDYYGVLTYSDGEIVSTLKVYYLSDNLYFESEVWDTHPIEFDDGCVTFYNENGSVWRKITYKNNIRNGAAEFYDENGSLLQKGQYVEGASVGEWEDYYEDGSYGKGMIEDDYKTGLWKYYTSDGIKESEGYWLNGSREGEWLYYTTEGEINIKGNFKGDAEDGDWTQYFNDDSFGRGRMTAFKKCGEWVFYKADGSILMKGNYTDDLQDGLWYQYDAHGKLSLTVKYENGNQVED